MPVLGVPRADLRQQFVGYFTTWSLLLRLAPLVAEVICGYDSGHTHGITAVLCRRQKDHHCRYLHYTTFLVFAALRTKHLCALAAHLSLFSFLPA